MFKSPVILNLLVYKFILKTYTLFFCYLNGELKNKRPLSKIEIFNIPYEYYELMITFTSSTDTLFRKLGLSPNVKTIYSIKRKKNNKAVIRFASESNLDGSAIENPSVVKTKMVKPSINNCGNLTGGIDDIQLFINELIQYQFDEEKISLNLIFNLGFIGVLLFSGSIYLLTTNQIINIKLLKILWPITPIGGILMISSWLTLAFKAKKSEFKP